MMRNFISMLLVMLMASTIDAFVTGGVWSHRPAFVSTTSSSSFYAANGEDDNDLPTLERVPPDEGVPIPFVDVKGNSFIECFADSIATINGVEYTIGVPCDYSVALCYFDENEQLIPVELDDEMMDDVFPIAENIVSDEFGEELALQRTPQTLTLVGELEEDDDEDDEDDEDDDMEDGEEEVEILLSFEHRGKEFNLVRLLDPVLLVGKADTESPDRRLLLSPEESDAVMPVLEDMFLEFHEERDMTL